MKLKKPKFWDYNKPNLISYFLNPFAKILELKLKFSKKSKNKFNNIKTICVGNIYVGGTGKTSLSIKINELLRNKNIKSCFVKKFYKKQIDEQEILKAQGKLFLSKNRIEGVLDAEKENYEIAILDDGLQDQSIIYDTSIICFNTINWIGNGMTIPSGPLRESINNLKNYKYLFLNGNLENLETIKEIFKINSKINIYIGKYEPKNLNEFDTNHKYLVFSGIGNHKTFVSMLKKNNFKILKEIEYADHYKFTKKDLDEIIDSANQLNCKIITTEKDFIRLGNNKSEKIKFIKSELKIINEDKFIKSII